MSTSSNETAPTQTRRDSSLVATAPGALLVGVVALGIVLRLWWANVNGLSFDEAFTAVAARRSPAGLLTFLRNHDSHPPLDYFLRWPMAHLGAPNIVLRAPSLAFSIAALALFAWWMRQRPAIVAVTATALVAVSPFLITCGSEARMYALLELLGVSGAVVSEQFLRAPRRVHAWWIGGIVLVALFDHVSGLLLAAGAIVVPGTRRDAASWRWRAAIATAVGIWAAVWGADFLKQRSGRHASWIPRTTPSGVLHAIGGQLSATSGTEVMLAVAVIFGLAVIAYRDRTLARVALSCAVVPTALAALIGLFAPFFLARTLTVTAWAPPLALGVLVHEVRSRHARSGLAATVVVGLFVVPGTLLFLARRWEVDTSIAQLDAVVRPGDVVAVTPAWYSPLVEWRVVLNGDRPARRVAVAGLRDTDAWVLGRGNSHRAWVVSIVGDPRTFDGFERCAPDWSDGVTRLSCLRLSGP